MGGLTVSQTRGTSHRGLGSKPPHEAQHMFAEMSSEHRALWNKRIKTGRWSRIKKVGGLAQNASMLLWMNEPVRLASAPRLPCWWSAVGVTGCWFLFLISLTSLRVQDPLMLHYTQANAHRALSAWEQEGSEQCTHLRREAKEGTHQSPVWGFQ